MAADYKQWALREFVLTLGRHVSHYKYFTALGSPAFSCPADFPEPLKNNCADRPLEEPSSSLYPIVVISYADLLWRRSRTLQRLQDFVPEAGQLMTDYEPQLGVDHFPKNQLKTRGTVAEFARLHPPASLGYDVVSQSCAISDVDPLRQGWTVLDPPHRQLAQDYTAYLVERS